MATKRDDTVTAAIPALPTGDILKYPWEKNVLAYNPVSLDKIYLVSEQKLPSGCYVQSMELCALLLMWNFIFF